jgi:hypothetical protein
MFVGVLYVEVIVLAASTSLNRRGSKLARDTRTTAVLGNDAGTVILSDIMSGSRKKMRSMPVLQLKFYSFGPRQREWREPFV